MFIRSRIWVPAAGPIYSVYKNIFMCTRILDVQRPKQMVVKHNRAENGS